MNIKCPSARGKRPSRYAVGTVDLDLSFHPVIATRYRARHCKPYRLFSAGQGICLWACSSCCLASAFLIPHLSTQDDGLDEHARARLLTIESFQKIPGIGLVSTFIGQLQSSVLIVDFQAANGDEPG